MEEEVELKDREEQHAADQQVQLAESEQDNWVERNVNHDKELQCSPYHSQITNKIWLWAAAKLRLILFGQGHSDLLLYIQGNRLTRLSDLILGKSGLLIRMIREVMLEG